MRKSATPITLLFFALVYMALCPRVVAQKPLTKEQKTWTPAPAVVIKSWQVSAASNKVGLELKITPAVGPPFTAQIHHTYSFMEDAYNNYKTGKTATVRYDPGAMPIDPDKPTNKVVIDNFDVGTSNVTTRTISSSSNANPNQMAGLMKCDSLHRLILSYGDTAQSVILEYKSYLNANITVNGSNPVITLILEVLPNGKAPFKATVEGMVIGGAFVSKYLPGQRLYVRYDPNDLTKVAVDHSE